MEPPINAPPKDIFPGNGVKRAINLVWLVQRKAAKPWPIISCGNLRPEQLLSELIYRVAETLGAMDQIGLIVLDAGFGTEANVSELQADFLSYLVKGGDPRTFQKIAKALAEYEWDYTGPH